MLLSDLLELYFGEDMSETAMKTKRKKISLMQVMMLAMPVLNLYNSIVSDGKVSREELVEAVEMALSVLKINANNVELTNDGKLVIDLYGVVI